jgi:hypothetical protein
MNAALLLDGLDCAVFFWGLATAANGANAYRNAPNHLSSASAKEAQMSSLSFRTKIWRFA